MYNNNNNLAYKKIMVLIALPGTLVCALIII